MPEKDRLTFNEWLKLKHKVRLEEDLLFSRALRNPALRRLLLSNSMLSEWAFLRVFNILLDFLFELDHK